MGKAGPGAWPLARTWPCRSPRGHTDGRICVQASRTISTM